MGPNGAGKSTALKILSGQTNASYGQVFLFGEDIEENTAFLRENVGVCPQENILWDRMSAIEHVWFYGRLKGMSSRGLTAIARSTLTQFMLDDSIHKLSSQMSGGMKRRLMICNSLITNPKLLVMDEITAGLDPLTKHRVWEKIKSLRNDRIILLTTHNMEEADFLGDEIVILYGGRIRAFGNSLFLKNRFGAGYQVKVVTSSSFTTVVVDNVRKLLPAATIVSQEAGAITISLPRRALASFPKFFHWLESQRIPGSNAENSEEDLALKGWSFSNSTLEEVFLRLCSDEKSVNKGISEAGPQLCALCNERYSESVTVYTKQGIAVIAENLLCHRCATGEEQETLFGDLDKVTKEMEDEKNGESNLSNTKKIRSSIPEYNHEKVHPSFNRVPFMTLTYRQIRGVILKNLSLSLVQKWSIIVRLFILIILSLLNIPFSLSGLGGGGILCAQGYKSISGSCTIGVTYDNNEHLTFQRSDGVQKWLMQYPYYSSDPKVWQVMYSDSSLSGSTDFSELYNVFGQEIYYAQSLQSIFVKFGGGTNAPATDVDSFIEERESQLLNFLTVKTSFIGENNCSSSWIPAERVVSMNSTDSLFDILTPIVVEINEMNFASRSFDFTFHHVGASTMENFTRFNYLNVWRDSFISGTGERDICQQIYWMDLDVDELLLEISHLFTYLIARKSNPDARISAAIVKLPILEYPSVVASVSSTSKVVASVLCVFLTTFFFNDHVNRQVYEKSDDLFFLIKVSGMHPWIYWLANYVHDFFFNIVVSLIYFICRYVTNYPVHQGASKGFLVLCLFLGAHTMACFVAFFTIFFKRSFPARMLAFLLIFALAGLSPAFISNSFPSWLEKLLTFIPPIAFSRSIGLTFSFAPYSFDHTLTLLSMAFISPLFLLVGVLRVDSGARFYLFRKLCSRSKRERSASVTNSFISVVEDNVDVKVPIELRTLPYSNAPIKIDHLSKKYKGASKWSLKDLTVNVDYGECFGLLGPNGAGKSTALNILCGYLWPSNGTVKILEHDLLSEAQEISGMMGVCPQFDKSWDDLTVRQHFLFFARIKGIDPSLERGLAQKTAEMVSLDGDVMHQKASTLSGGNRRRISIAISLIGDPTIWLIDEPTSSLSPEIRRMIWEVIDNQKKAGRAIILTTHSMDEADALCSRIGIMVRGSMKTCGTPTFLKEKYGEGYYFTLTFDQKITKSLIDESLALVRKNFCSSAVYLENIESEKFATFLFPKGSTSTTDVLRVFEIMEGKQGEFKKVHHIAEWGISQATLEDIFIKTVETENQS